MRTLLSASSLVSLALASALIACPAVAAQVEKVRLRSSTPETSLRSTSAVPGCPNKGGLLDSISVPVNQSIALAVQIPSALTTPVSFQLRARNPSVVAAGDKVQGFLPVVTVPAGQVVSNTFNLFGVSVGATSLDIIPLSSGFSTSSFPAGAWDVNKSGGSSSKFVDANPPSSTCRASADSADISTSGDVLARCGATVDGVAADGATQLLMRTLSGLPGTACFEITSASTADQGTVATPLSTSQAVSGLSYAFSLLKAPANYGADSASRKVSVTFTFTPSIGNSNTTRLSADLTVLRPPLVLMHGLWSKPGAWDSSFVRNDASHTTVKGDYKKTNAAHFSTNVPKVKEAIDSALKQFRANQKAVTQVDVIGHSMGGILTRLYANSSENVRPENYNRGDIRRLITLDTPHWGSTLANLLVSLHEVAPRRVGAIGAFVGSVNDGAVCDLAENSPALGGLGATAVPGSTIIARGGTFPAYSSAIETALTARVCSDWTLGLPPTCNAYAYLFPQNRVDGFRFKEDNDEIVGMTDQQGGLGGWSFPSLIHTNVNVTPAVAKKAFELLDGPAGGLAGTGFPPAQSTGLGNPAAPPRGVSGLGEAQDRADYAAQCGPDGPMNPASTRSPASTHRSDAASALVTVTSPAPQQRFAPGDTVNINVAVDVSLAATDVVVGLPPASLATTTRIDAVNYQTAQVIPADYSGPMTITPIAVDARQHEIEGIPVTINVVPATTPTRVAFVQRHYFVDPGAGTQQLSLIGTFGSSAQMLDISSPESGTVYSTNNAAVATVSPEGLVTIVGSGTALVRGANGAASDLAVFVVETAGTPLPPQNVTSSFTIQRGGIRLDRNTGFYVQSVVVTNKSGLPIPGSAFLVLTGLPADVSLVNKSGTTATAVPGAPFVTLPLSSDGRTLAPGQTSTLNLQFLNPNRSSIAYSSTVYRRSIAP